MSPYTHLMKIIGSREMWRHYTNESTHTERPISKQILQPLPVSFQMSPCKEMAFRIRRYHAEDILHVLGLDDVTIQGR